MKKVTLKPAEAFPLSPDEKSSFRGLPTPVRLGGPFTLVRLVQRGRRLDGDFWFEEQFFRRLRDQAKADLAAQNPGRAEPYSRPMQDMIGMYLRHCLRQDLAICKNWTEDFDSFASLTLRPADALIAWVGPIAKQPYYSKPDPADEEYEKKKELYETAEAGGVSLMAAATQYVIKFDFPANRALKARIAGPLDF